MTKSFVMSGLVAVGLAAGCAAEQPTLGSTAGITFEEFKARVSIEPGTGYYIVDWDTIVATDDELLEFYYRFQQGALAIYTQGGVDRKWDATQKKQLTYCVSNNFGARKQIVVDAMRNAAENGWEKFADVDFVYVPAQDGNCTAANNNVLFDVNPITGADYTARAFFPGDARQLRNVIIDQTAFQLQGQVTLTNVIAHELGHVLGFRHEHTRPEAGAAQCYEDNQFRALTPYDSASVMHYPQCNGTSATLAFTQRDQQGVALVYGAPVQNVSPMANVTAPVNGETVGSSFTVTANVVDTNLAKAELFIDGALYQTLQTGPFIFQVTNLAAGPHTLEIRGTDQAGLTGTQTLTVTVAASGGGGNGTGGGNGGGTGGGTGDDDSYEDNTITGGCSTGGGTGSAGLAIGLALVLVGRRRSRR